MEESMLGWMSEVIDACIKNNASQGEIILFRLKKLEPSKQTMETFNASFLRVFSPEQIPWLGLLVSFAITGVVYLIFHHTVFREDHESPVHFTVPIPDHCKSGVKGEILENPNIRVS